MTNTVDILKERAKRLAIVFEEEKKSANEMIVVVFVIATERFAIESRYIQEVYPMSNLTPLPCAPPHIYGVMNVRRRILSVIDLGNIFEISGGDDEGSQKKIIILEYEGMDFGILVDTVLGIRDLLPEEIQPTLPTITGIRQEFFKGVTADGLVLLDGKKILTEEKIIVNKESL